MADPAEDAVQDDAAPAEGAAATETNEAAEKATLQGWKPKEQFAGDPDKWVDAETFLKRGEEMAPVLKRELDKANRQIEKLEETVKRLDAYSTKAEQRAYERAKADLQAQLEASAEAGDVEGVKAAAKGITDLEKEAKPANGVPADFDQAFKAWEKDNSWFSDNNVMQAAAVAVYGEFEAQGLKPAEALKKVTERIREEFPKKFDNPRRQEAAAVEGGVTARKPGGKTYSDLPADAKAECDYFVKNVKGFTKDRYAKDYFGAQ